MSRERTAGRPAHRHLTDFETGVRYMAFTDAVHDSLAAGCRVATV
jgi:hypothetical protein